MILLTMTIVMYAGMYILLKSDKSMLKEYEKRQILKKTNMGY